MYPAMSQYLAQAYQEDLLRRAQRDRLARHPRRGRPAHPRHGAPELAAAPRQIPSIEGRRS